MQKHPQMKKASFFFPLLLDENVKLSEVMHKQVKSAL